MSHHLRCPVCQSQIPVDLRLLAQGVAFPCPNLACGAAIGIERGSVHTFSSALFRYESLAALQTSGLYPVGK